MKIKLIFTISLFTISFLFFISLISYAQNDVTVLNGYKYVYLFPLNYKNGNADIWGIRGQIKEKLIASGLKVIETEAQLEKINDEICLLLGCVISHTSNEGQYISDYLYLKFQNCEDEVIYSSQGETGATVRTFQKGWTKATKEALSDFNKYVYKFNASEAFATKFESTLPDIEMTKLTEKSIREYLISNKLNPIEGVYKNYQSEGVLNYRLGIVKMENTFKAVVIDSDARYWEQGEVKATFESTSINGLYSTKWYADVKEEHEAFASLENESILSIEIEDSKTGKKRKEKFIKLFPTTSNSTINKGNSRGSGSGFFLTTSGIIATNYSIDQPK